VESIKGRKLFVTRKNAVKLQKNEYFIADLIGMRVIDEEKGLEGLVDDVIQTGANDVYDITLADGRNLLLPAIKDCVLNVDIESRVIKIHILEGLLD
jgi:16S rRNA processing protein RimM